MKNKKKDREFCTSVFCSDIVLSVVKIFWIDAENIGYCKKLYIGYGTRIIFDSRDRAAANVDSQELQLIR